MIDNYIKHAEKQLGFVADDNDVRVPCTRSKLSRTFIRNCEFIALNDLFSSLASIS